MNFELGLDRLSPREQRLLGIFGILLGVFLVLGLPAYILSSVSDSRQTNESIRDLLQKMGRSEQVLAERKQKRDQLLLRYQRPAPALAGFIEKAAQQNGLEVPQSTDRPDIQRGKNYVERVTVVKMRKIGMLALVRTLEKLVGSGHPVAISRLNINKRGVDSYDVELGVSAYDRKETDKDKGTGEDQGKDATGKDGEDVDAEDETDEDKGQRL